MWCRLALRELPIGRTMTNGYVMVGISPAQPQGERLAAWPVRSALLGLIPRGLRL